MKAWNPSEKEIKKMLKEWMQNWGHLTSISDNLGRIATVLERMDARTVEMERKWRQSRRKTQ